MAEIFSHGFDCLDAVKKRLEMPENINKLNEIADEFEKSDGQHSISVYIRRGRAKVNERYPTVCLELVSEDDQMAALNFTRDCLITLNVLVMLKVAVRAEEVENYISKMAAAVKSILDQDGNLTYLDISPRHDNIYDSITGAIQYGYLYAGAIRAAQMQWQGHVYRVHNMHSQVAVTPGVEGHLGHE
jgi:hypothetical protein